MSDDEPTTLTEHLDDTLSQVRRDGDNHPAPWLRDAFPAGDRDLLAVALCTAEGEVRSAGNTEHVFPLQSVSKAFVYALVLEQHGIDAVLDRVDVEPSGEAYDMLSLEEGSRRPDNPMINAGAMTIHSMIGSDDATEDDRVQLIVDGLSKMAGRDLDVDDEAAADELRGGHRNLAIAHLLRAEEILAEDPLEVVRGYLRQCWIRVTCEDLARMAATLAHGGVQPCTGERVVSEDVARQVLSVMMTCGMYDSAGDWMSEVGIPAKSGVSGAIMGALPGRVGLAAYSPMLDPHGTSFHSQQVFERLADDLGLHLLDDPHRRDSVWNQLVTGF